MIAPLATRGLIDLIGGIAFLAAAVVAQTTDVIPPATDNIVTLVLALIGGGGILGWAVRVVITTVLRRGDEDRAADRELLKWALAEIVDLRKQQGESYETQLATLRDIALRERPGPVS